MTSPITSVSNQSIDWSWGSSAPDETLPAFGSASEGTMILAAPATDHQIAPPSTNTEQVSKEQGYIPVKLETDVFKYIDASLNVFNCEAVFGSRKFSMLTLTKPQAEAWCALHEKHILDKPEYYHLIVKQPVDIRTLIATSQQYAPLRDLYPQIEEILKSKEFSDGAFFRGLDASSKDVNLDPEGRQEKEIEIWQKYELQVGFPLEDLFQNANSISELYEKLKTLECNFSEAIAFLSMDLKDRVQRHKFYFGLKMILQQMLAIDSAQRAIDIALENPFNKHRNIMGMHALVTRSTEMLNFMDSILTLESEGSSALLQQLNTFVKQFVSMIKKLRKLEITDREQFCKNFYEILATEPEKILSGKIREQILPFLVKLGFDRQKFETYKSAFQFFRDNSPMAAILGAIESDILLLDRDQQRMRNADQVMNLALRSYRLYLNAKSYSDKDEPFALGFAPFVKMDQEIRCFTDYNGNLTAISSLVHSRSRAVSMPVSKHPLQEAIKKAAIDLFTTKIGKEHTRMDFIIPGRWAVSYMSEVLGKMDVAHIIKDYIGLNTVIYLAIEINGITNQVLSISIIERNPGFTPSDEEQIVDANLFTWEEIQARLKKNKENSLTSQDERVEVRLADYTLGGILRTSDDLLKNINLVLAPAASS